MPKKLGAEITEEILARRAAAARRMRRSRSRRGKGLRCYNLELHDTEIAALVRHGLLLPERQTDQAAIIKAMYAFLDRTLGRPT